MSKKTEAKEQEKEETTEDPKKDLTDEKEAPGPWAQAEFERVRKNNRGSERVVTGSESYLEEFLNRMHPHGDFSDAPELAHIPEKFSYAYQMKGLQGKIRVVQFKRSEPGLPHLFYAVTHEVNIDDGKSATPEFAVPREDLTNNLERAYPEHSFQVMSTTLQGKHPSFYIKVNIDGIDRNVLLRLPEGADPRTLDSSKLAGYMRDSLRVYTNQ